MSLIENEQVIDDNTVVDMTGQQEADAPNDGMDFMGDPMANKLDTPKPVVLDPNQDYQFGDKMVSGQDMIQKMVVPESSAEVSTLKQTVEGLTQQIQALAQESSQNPVPSPAPEPPVSQLNTWMKSRFGDNPEDIDTLSPQDFMQGLVAMQQDTTLLITELAEQVNPKALTRQIQAGVQQQLQQQGQQLQLQGSKEGAVDQAVSQFVTNKAQSLGVTPDELQSKYDYIARTIKNSGTYLLSDNVGDIQKYALDELQAWDKHQQEMVGVQSQASTDAGKRQNRALIRESQRMIKNLENPQSRAQVMSQLGQPTPIPQVTQQPQPQPQQTAPNPFYTRTGQIDEDAVLQHTKQSGNTQRY